MKKLIAASLTLAMATPILADRAMAGLPTQQSAEGAASCSVSSSDSGTVIQVTNRLKVWQLMQGQSGASAIRMQTTAGEGGRLSSVGFLALNASEARARTPGTETGISDRHRIEHSGDPHEYLDGKARCVQGQHIKSVTITRRSNQPIVTKDVDNFTCSLSDEPSDPLATLSLIVPTSGEVVIQDIHFDIADGVTTVSRTLLDGSSLTPTRCTATITPRQ